jgi:hypothetical protein
MVLLLCSAADLCFLLSENSGSPKSGTLDESGHIEIFYYPPTNSGQQSAYAGAGFSWTVKTGSSNRHFEEKIGMET